MLLKTFNSKAYPCFPTAVLIAFLLAGCAGKRWDSPMIDEESAPIISIVQQMAEAEKQCSDSLETDAKIFWTSPVGDRALEGYLQLLEPGYAKFIISNPLGQPVFAFTRTGKDFQILDPAGKLHIRGRILSLAIRKDIPLLPARGDWFSYLSGRLTKLPATITEIAKDNSNDTVWIRMSPPPNEKNEEGVYVQIDPSIQKVTGYLFLDFKGEITAEIRYPEQNADADACTPHNEVYLSGLPWGSKVTVKMDALSTSRQFKDKDFVFKVPKGYATQLWP